MKPRKWINKEIKTLDPEEDYAKIVDIIMNWRDKNPFFHHLGYTYLFLRAVAVPGIASIVYNAGKGRMIRATAIRADETLHIVGAWYRNGPESEETRKSIEKLNAIHSKFNISNDLNIYTIATFLITPDLFRRSLGFSSPPKWEKAALVNFWTKIGTMMHIENLPESWNEFQSFFDQYEEKNFAFTEDGMQCAEALVNEFVNRWFKNNPEKGRAFLLAIFDRRLRKVFPFDYPNSVKSFLLKRYIGILGQIKKMRKPDSVKPLYVEETFNPKRPENTGAPR